MTTRITDKHLNGLIQRINTMLDVPTEAYSKDETGKLKANIGTWHLTGAYGGVSVYEVVNIGGGVTTPLGGGYVTKRELYNKLSSFIAGLEWSK